MKELFDYLFANKITPNGLFTLYALHGDVTYANYVSYTTEQHRLVLTGHLIQKDNTFLLTDSGKHIIREAENIMSRMKAMKKKDVPFSEWESYIREYVSIFPAGTKGGIPIRSTPKQLYERFRWFFAEYPEFSWEDVLKATSMYISEQMDKGKDALTYMSTSKYFIKKDDKNRNTTSLLADWCSAVESGDIDDLTTRGTAYFGSDIV